MIWTSKWSASVRLIKKMIFCFANNVRVPQFFLHASPTHVRLIVFDVREGPVISASTYTRLSKCSIKKSHRRGTDEMSSIKHVLLIIESD